MSRLWITLPTSLAAAVGGTLGWTITQVACRPDTCVAWSLIVGLIGAAVAAMGVALVMVLVVRSLEEWRAAEAVGAPAPEAGCELPDPDGGP